MTLKIILSVLVFFVLSAGGLGIASKKLLWSDELLTQQNAIDRLDYGGILRMEFSEGNISPLFYLGQELICQLTGYRLPVAWSGEFCVYEPQGQVILRVLPVLYMSAAAALLFFYFYCRFSFLTAAAALMAALSYFSFWVFMPEARPYSLWFLLCSLQGMAFMEILRADGWQYCRRWLVLLGVSHWLMSLTIIFSAVPIAAVTVGVFWKYRMRFFKSALWLSALPLMACWLYYYFSKKTFAGFDVVLPQDPAGITYIVWDGIKRSLREFAWTNYILLNVPPYWLLFILFGSGALLRSCCWRLPEAEQNLKRLLPGMLAVLVMMLAGAFVLVSSLLSWETRKAGVVAERYFLFLSPFAILTTLLLYKYLLSLWGDVQWRWLVRLVFAGVVLLSALWSAGQLMNWGPFWSL